MVEEFEHVSNDKKVKKSTGQNAQIKTEMRNLTEWTVQFLSNFHFIIFTNLMFKQSTI